MILIHIIPNEHSHANEIVDLLVEKKLILNAMIMDGVTIRQKNKHGEMENISRPLILGKTKALLFNVIDQSLQEKYGKDKIALYSLPHLRLYNLRLKSSEKC